MNCFLSTLNISLKTTLMRIAMTILHQCKAKIKILNNWQASRSLPYLGMLFNKANFIRFFSKIKGTFEEGKKSPENQKRKAITNEPEDEEVFNTSTY